MKPEKVLSKRERKSSEQDAGCRTFLTSLSLPGVDLEELGERVTSLAEKGEKWGVRCLRGELLCQTLRRECSWDPLVRSPSVTCLCGWETCESRSAPSRARHRETCAAGPARGFPLWSGRCGQAVSAQAGRCSAAAALTLVASPGCSADGQVLRCGRAATGGSAGCWQGLCRGACSSSPPAGLSSSDTSLERLLVAGFLK